MVKWGQGHKKMLRPNGTNTGPKTLKCHEALKMLQAGIMSVLASWDRDDGYSKNMLEDLIGQLTVITRELTSELVDCKDVPKLQNLVDEFFKSSLERDGSPDWLVINTHLLSHFPDQLLMYGPIRGTWMYVFESFNGKIRRWVKNNAYPVQSVMQGFGRYRMVHVVRGLILVLRRRREATTNPTRPPVLPFLATAPLRAPNTVVLGTQGTRHVLSRAETKALELWMHGNVPQYRKLKAKFDDYVTYCKRENHMVRRRIGARAGASRLMDVPLHMHGSDPKVWLGRPFTENEAALVEGPPRVCQSFGSVVVRGVCYRTAAQDKTKKTCQRYFRAFFSGENIKGEEIETDRCDVEA
ncbi:hypothetical protein CYMTET_13918 [Cymbomonas tetramitiformis]|uniref:DUF4218 domain-containing protein n=1 Tax=Cymbomonas tetramitiformis TaxID=36881 RepID=A0AAE0GHD8_9CHLO|nr:hypothetical protein CYMTET_13918 [Cymbomonas tetramitiformis]